MSYPTPSTIWDLTHPKGGHESLSIAGGRVRSATGGMQHMIKYPEKLARQKCEDVGWVIKVIVQASQDCKASTT